jgi:S-DNA-T family DNA segregation ATPase FtsK/SpoIIIE
MTKKGKKINNERKKELLGILIMALALLVFLGLISYHPADYPNSGSMEEVQNWLGLAGAYISYTLYVYTIGYSCLVIPFLLFLFGWYLFLQRSFKPFFRLSLYILAIGIFLSTVLAMPEAVSDEGSKYGYRLSGLLGGFLAEQISHYLGAVGSIVVLLTLMLILLISATSWSMRETVIGFKEEVRDVFQSLAKKRKGINYQSKQTVKRDVKNDPISNQKEVKITTSSNPFQASLNTTKVEIKLPVTKPVEVKNLQKKINTTTGEYRFPSLDLLTPQFSEEKRIDRQDLENKANFLEEKLREFDVRGTVVGIQPGPVITRFEISPAPGIKVSRFMSIQDDLALVMRASRVRVIAPIPGKAAVGIEIPNEEPTLVTLRGIIESKPYQNSSSKLTIALGQTIEGQPYVTDLAHMPHLLIAGATGSGKSVCLNTIIVSILYRAKASEVKFVLIDPKKLELALYRKLRNHHLTTRQDLNEEVITTVDNAVAVLRSLEMEMEKRYKLLAKVGVRNINDFNKKVEIDKIQIDEDIKLQEKLPYIILVVDELADLMVMGAREIEEPIARLAQMSRAVGIHLILATQRPSVDVITGVIKANFPSRIAFQVAAKTDSRTILDRNGAEKLLGCGDMLFLHPREPEPLRIHGAFLSTEEVQKVVDFISRQPHDMQFQLTGSSSKDIGIREGRRSDRDELFEEAAKLVVRHQQGSASLLQRRLRIGYARAGRIIDELEEIGILGPFDGSKAREVLIDETGLEQLLNSEPLTYT